VSQLDLKISHRPPVPISAAAGAGASDGDTALQDVALTAKQTEPIITKIHTDADIIIKEEQEVVSIPSHPSLFIEVGRFTPSRLTISFHFISFHFISFHFISFHFISFHFINIQYCTVFNIIKISSDLYYRG
jgi:hypothetical protein